MIRDIRLRTNMTQQEFGDYFGIPARTIQNWEGGQRTPPEYLVELIKYKAEKERLGMLKLVEKNEGQAIEHIEGDLEEIIEWLIDNYQIFDFIWEGVAEEHRINTTIPYEALEGEDKELFIDKMPQLEDIETLRELEYELKKVDLGWWTLEVEK